MKTNQSTYLSKTEQYVYDLFSSVLKNNELSIEVDFFTMGGDSMDVVQLLAQLKSWYFD